jgi:hypothetical protein
MLKVVTKNAKTYDLGQVMHRKGKGEASLSIGS